jgi:predicted nucleotidyltransferase
MISKDQALDILRRHKAELKALGVRRAAVFGSVSRGEAGPDSDLDIMIELDEPNKLTMFDYAGIKRQVAELFPVRTDVVAKDSMKRAIGTSALRDAVYAF